MIEFRFLIEKRLDKHWDDRWDEWQITEYNSKPVLQYRILEDGVKPIWRTVPTVTEVVK